MSSKDFHEFKDRLEWIDEKLADMSYSQKPPVAMKCPELKIIGVEGGYSGKYQIR